MIKDGSDKNIAKRDNNEKIAELPEGLKGFKEDSFQDKEIKIPDNAIKTSRAEFNKLREAMKKDPEGFVNAQMAGTASNLKITRTITKTSDSTVKKNTNNNPLELSDK